MKQLQTYYAIGIAYMYMSKILTDNRQKNQVAVVFFLGCIVPRDKTWISYHTNENKQQSVQMGLHIFTVSEKMQDVTINIENHGGHHKYCCFL